MTSAAAAERHAIAKDAWGERGWLTVGRLCRFFKGHKMDIECPPPPD